MIGWLELKYASRSLRQARSFSLLVILTFGLGIGTTTGFISIVNGVLLSPLPYDDPDRLVMIFQRSPGAGVDEDSLSPPQVRDILEQSTTFDGLAMMTASRLLLTREGPAEHAEQLWASSSLLRMIGARPHMGRLLTEEDDRTGAPLVVILTHALWETRFGSDPAIVDTTIGVEHVELEVVGVLEPGLLLDAEVLSNNFTQGRFDLVTSLSLSEKQAADRTREMYRVVGKLKRGASVIEAQAELDVIAARMLAENPPTIRDESFTLEVVSLLDQTVGGVRRGLMMLLAAAGVFCLIACLNATNLMLTRAGSRQTEIGVSVAIGASRRRILARVLTESFLLASLGAALGLGLAWCGINAVARLGPVNVPRMDMLAIDRTSFVAAMLLALVTSLLAGIVPAWRLANIDPRVAIAQGAGSRGVIPKRVGTPSAFVIVQVALAFVLLVSAALVSRSFAALLDVDTGFDAEGLLSLRISQRIDNDRPPEALFDVIREIPGARGVAMGSPLPFAPGAWWAPIAVEGYETAPYEPAAIVDRRRVSPGYFEVMRIPLVSGRTFQPSDLRPDAVPVRIVDRFVAEKFWPDEDPLGKRVYQTERTSTPGERPPATVVGVVEHVRHDTLETDGRMTLYLPAPTVDRSYLLVRTDGDPNALAKPVLAAIRALDPEVAADDVTTMDGRVDDALAPRRLALALAHALAWLALTLASIGVFGRLSYAVVEGTPEIGVRMALGASTNHILRWVLCHGLHIVGIGLAVGAGLAYLGSRLLSSMLFEVSPTDPWAYALSAIVVLGTGLSACWIPAHRASKVDPIEALRVG